MSLDQLAHIVHIRRFRCWYVVAVADVAVIAIWIVCLFIRIFSRGVVVVLCARNSPSYQIKISTSQAHKITLTQTQLLYSWSRTSFLELSDGAVFFRSSSLSLKCTHTNTQTHTFVILLVCRPLFFFVRLRQQNSDEVNRKE